MSEQFRNTFTRVGAGGVLGGVGTLASPSGMGLHSTHNMLLASPSRTGHHNTTVGMLASPSGTGHHNTTVGTLASPSGMVHHSTPVGTIALPSCMGHNIPHLGTLASPSRTGHPSIALSTPTKGGPRAPTPHPHLTRPYMALVVSAPTKGGPRAPTTHPHHTRPYAALVLSLLFAFAFLLFLLPASAHAAGGTGRIYGQLLDGTKRNAPLAGQSVTLQMAQGDTSRDLTSVTTDAHGTFSFSGLDTDKTINYALYILYQGAQYYTDLIDLSTKPVQQINLTVYDATASIANIAIVQANVLIDKADAHNGLITISENFFFENLGLTTYVGSLQTNGSKPNALRFSLPNNARNLSLRSGFNGSQVIQVEPGFASDAALPPGTSQFAFSFQVPYTTSSYDFSYTAVYPTVDLTLLAPLQFHASSAGMDSQGPVNANQHTYQQFKAQKLLAGAQIHVQLEGLPLPQPAPSPSPLNQNTLWIIVALLLMLAIVSVTWFIYRLSRRQTPRRGGRGVDVGRGPLGRPWWRKIPPTPRRGGRGVDVGRGPLGRPSSNSTRPSPANPYPSSNGQQEALLQELLDLDTAYEAGKIKKTEYQERRANTKAQLRSLMEHDVVAKPATSKRTARRSGKGSS